MSEQFKKELEDAKERLDNKSFAEFCMLCCAELEQRNRSDKPKKQDPPQNGGGYFDWADRLLSWGC